MEPKNNTPIHNLSRLFLPRQLFNLIAAIWQLGGETGEKWEIVDHAMRETYPHIYAAMAETESDSGE